MYTFKALVPIVNAYNASSFKRPITILNTEKYFVKSTISLRYKLLFTHEWKTVILIEYLYKWTILIETS
jgi:hypothetical protein